MDDAVPGSSRYGRVESRLEEVSANIVRLEEQLEDMQGTEPRELTYQTSS